MPLNRYSESARNAIAESFPALIAHLREQPDESFFVDFQSPSGAKFWMSTQGNELTIGLDVHHVHFGTFWELDTPDAAEDMREASDYIQKLISGAYRVAIWSRHGKFVQSETIERGVNPTEVSRSWLCWWWLKGCSVKVVEW